MLRLTIGSVLLIAALATGWLTGNTGEDRTRAAIRINTEESLVYEVERSAPPARDEGTASVQAEEEESPETSDLVERMRRRLPALSEWQAEEIRAYHEGYRKKLRDRAFGITAALGKDRETQRQAVVRMRELRRERTDFMRDILGREAWAQWHRIEITGGRDVDEFLRQMQERSN